MQKGKEPVDEAQGLDRISRLPDSLCHEILRRLPASDARTTGLLSRRWRSIWYSCPFYDFDEDAFRDSIFNSMTFSEFVLDTLELHERYSNDSVIEFLRLKMGTYQIYESHCLDRSSILDRGLDAKELHLDCGGILPNHFLISQSITVLKLTHCGIESSYPINMPVLKTLYLETVRVSDDGLEKLVSNCPSIENLSLVRFWRLINVNINGPELKHLFARLTFFSQASRIEAPKLEILDFMCDRFGAQFEIAATRLKFLNVSAFECLSNDALQNLILQNPHLEKLGLRNSTELRQPASIKSQSLRHFVLTVGSCIKLNTDAAQMQSFSCRKLNIDAPQMQSFTLSANILELDLSINAPNLLNFSYEVVDMSQLELDSHWWLSNRKWYDKLKQLFEKFEQCRVLTVKVLEDTQLVVPGEIRESSTLQFFGVENLEVGIQKSTMNYSEILDGLRWSFPRLKTLKIEIAKPVPIHNKYWQTAGGVGTESMWSYMGFS